LPDKNNVPVFNYGVIYARNVALNQETA